MRGVADLLLPETCAGCRRPARGGLCRVCLDGLTRLGPFVCNRCGRPGGRPAPSCRDCRNRELYFDQARQAVQFGRVARGAVHRFKYRGCRHMGELLAELVAGACEESWCVDAVTWVSPSPERLRRTGTDHGKLLAELVAGRMGKPAVAMVRRVRRTSPQMSLDPGARRINVQGAFRATICPPARVLLVDDVFTTGSTASEVARALKVPGARNVFVAGVARSYMPDFRAYT